MTKDWHTIVSNDDAQDNLGFIGTQPTESAALEVVTAPSSPESSNTESVPIDAYFASFPEKELETLIGEDNRSKIIRTTDYPWRAICALRIRTQTGKDYVGTGWFISPRTLVTAGHCVYMEDEGGWAASIEVIPAMNGEQRPYGSCVAVHFSSVLGWVENRDRAYDYGAIILPEDCRFGETVGYFGFALRQDAQLQKSKLNLSGYPADKGAETQWFMASQSVMADKEVITYDIDTMGGQSGSPVWVTENNKRYAVGIHTNGSAKGNSATRIIPPVYNNLTLWKTWGV